MTGAQSLTLAPLGRIPGKRPLTWVGNLLYASEGYTLWRWEPGDVASVTSGWRLVARFYPGWMRGLSASTRLGSRLRRDGFHALAVLPDDTLVAVLPKAIAVLEPGDSVFQVTWRVRRGTRPLALAVTPDGAVYWGEYFSNPRRDPVHVYGSLDGGRTWEVVYTFPAGSIRHIHSITYDPFADCLWMLTGDNGAECRIMRVSLDWQTVEIALSGNQQTRAVTLVPTPRAVYFATDTPFEANYICRLGRDGSLERLARIAGSGMRGCRVGEALFFSAAVEPSRVNRYPFACLYGSADGRSWRKLVEWRKDRWPMRLFQYGNILLPNGPNETDILAASGVAVKGEDQIMHIWRVVCDGGSESGFLY